MSSSEQLRAVPSSLEYSRAAPNSSMSMGKVSGTPSALNRSHVILSKLKKCLILTHMNSSQGAY